MNNKAKWRSVFRRRKGSFTNLKVQKFLVLVSPISHNHEELVNLEQIFRYAKIDFDVTDLSSNWRSTLPLYSGIVFTSGSSLELTRGDVKQLEKFVRLGGGIFAINPGVTPATRKLFKIVDNPTATEERSSDSVHIHFPGNIFPGFEDLKIDHTDFQPANGLSHSDLDAVIILATLSSGFPLVWQRPLGLGSIVVWNINTVCSRRWRGLVLQALLVAPAVSLQFIANAASIQIDDFPAGFSDLESAVLREEFDMTFIPFLDQIWLPDMLEMSRELNVPYTCAIPFAYNDQTEAPYAFNEWTAVKLKHVQEEPFASVSFSRRLLDAGHELAMHGYNHVSLKLEFWPSGNAVSESLAAALQRWRSDGLGHDPFCYIPPMNEYDSEGIQAMSAALPSVKVVCGSEWEPPDQGGGREFGPEPWAPDLFCLPRWTHGYVQNQEKLLAMLSEVSMLGVWTHFIHADDILDTESAPGQTWKARNENRLPWRPSEKGSLRDSLKEWLSTTKKQFPWLRFMTASAAADVVQQYLDNKVSVKFTSTNEAEVIADHPADFILRIRRGDDPLIYSFQSISLLNHTQLSGCDILVLRLFERAGRVCWKVA